jgi:hypothetical protein
MSKAKAVGGLLVAAAVAIGGGAAERFTHLSPAVISGVVMLLSLLACYPAVKRWSVPGHNLTFKVWALGAAVASITATAIIAVVQRL